ncbi:MAG: hypothetical protein ACLURV_09010 [Gallintestinimicrobium sp.]
MCRIYGRKKLVWYDAFEIPDTQKSVTERICRKRVKKNESDFGAIMLGVMGILGGLPTLYLCVSLVVVLAQKIYGKVVHGKSLYA